MMAEQRFHCQAKSSLLRHIRFHTVIESRLDVLQQHRRVGRCEAQDFAARSRECERTVALDAGTIEVLRAHRARRAKERLAAGPMWVESGRVFTRENGEQLRPSWVTDRFAFLAADAGLPPIRLHDLRHGAATLALTAGVDMKTVQEMLGHSSITVTSDTYSTVLPEVARNAAEAIAGLVGRRTGTDGHTSGTQRLVLTTATSE